jgi:hypothetical protein
MSVTQAITKSSKTLNYCGTSPEYLLENVL